jgi:site-specific DNA recombinase
VRVSTEEQAKEGFGLDVQLRRCEAQAIVKGWEVDSAHVYRDEGLSGTLEASERPGLRALLAAVHAGQVNAVIILALDRLGRKSRIILSVVDEITDAGAELVSCKESLDTTTPAGRFVLSIFAALAQLERDNIVERTTAGRDERGRSDGERGGRLPYGYVRTDRGITIEREAAAVVKQIFKLKRTKKLSLRKIIEQLGEAPSPRGGAWHPSSVAEILRNEEAYRGGRRGESDARWPILL